MDSFSCRTVEFQVIRVWPMSPGLSRILAEQGPCTAANFGGHAF